MLEIEFLRKPRAYLAAPLFNKMERDFNARLEESLAPWIEVFLPQRDGGLMANLLAEGWALRDAQRDVFQKDISAIANSDVVVAVLDGRVVDEGVAVELGYAFALGKLCIGLKTDERTLLASGDNPMVVCSCNIIVGSVEEVIDVVRSSREFCLSNK